VIVEMPTPKPVIQEVTRQVTRDVIVERQGPPAGSLITADACANRGQRDNCNALMAASLRVGTSGPSLVLRVDSRKAIKEALFRLPTSLSVKGKRPLAVRTIGTTGQRRYIRYRRSRGRFVNASAGTPLVAAGKGSVRIRGLAAETGGIEVTVPVTSKQMRGLLGKKVTATVDGRRLSVKLPGKAPLPKRR
jgi:hypothetical protein